MQIDEWVCNIRFITVHGLSLVQVMAWNAYLYLKQKKRLMAQGLPCYCLPWWRHQMETFSALLVSLSGNPPVTGGFPSQRPVTLSFGVLFDLRLNKTFKQTIDTLEIWDAIMLIMTLRFHRDLNLQEAYQLDNRPPLEEVAAALKRTKLTAYIFAPIATLLLIVVWPAAASASGVFSYGQFQIWVSTFIDIRTWINNTIVVCVGCNYSVIPQGWF